MKSFLAVFIVFVMSAASAQEKISFKVDLDSPGKSATTFELTTLPKSVARYSNVTTNYVVNEVNSHFGEVEQKQTNAASGLNFQISYAKADRPSGPLEAFVEYELLENGLTVSKGTHRISIQPGGTVVLPTAHGAKLRVTAKA